MIPFIPDTPITVAYAVALALACGLALRFGGRAMWPLVAVMVLNWIGTRLITTLDAPSYAAGILDISSAIVLVAMPRRFRTMAVLPVAALFGLMVSSYLLNDLGLIERETMWAFADVGGYLQLLIIAGTAFRPGTALRLADDRHSPGGTDAMARAVARRLPPS